MYKCKDCGSEDVSVGYYVHVNDIDMDVYDDGFGVWAVYDSLPAHCNCCGNEGMLGTITVYEE